MITSEETITNPVINSPYQELADKAAEKIYQAIVQSTKGEKTLNKEL